MPTYEEKVISPLAVRFTQQRIRSTFKDGYQVEATIQEVKTLPGVGDYDIILDVPFPAIEIIRWSPHGRSGGEEAHWFTYDNRRLYCLQRLAAEHWPKRVGTIVEVLYADSGAIRKKLDTVTCGLSVSIGHAFAAASELEEWSWQKAVQRRAPPGNFVSQVQALVVADNAKSAVGDLMDAPTTPSSVERVSFDTETHSERNGIVAETSDLLRADGEAGNEQTSQVTNAQLPVGNALTGLIAQLMDLKTKEYLENHEKSYDGLSLQASDCTASTDSDVEALDSPLAASLDSDPVSASDEEGKMQQPQQPQQATEQLLAAPVEAPRQGNSSQDLTAQPNPKKKATKQSQTSKVAKQTAQTRQAAAQMQMAQWQMAQWQASQTAHWQHAALAYQASQAAQFNAALAMYSRQK